MDNWRVIMTFTFATEAHIAKGYLEANGIDTIIQDEMTAQINSFYSNAIGGVKLLVSVENYEAGIELLKEGGYINDPEAKDSFKVENVKVTDETNKRCCPFCGSANISTNKKLSVFMIPLYFILGALLPVFRRSRKCFDCGKEWRFVK